VLTKHSVQKEYDRVVPMSNGLGSKPLSSDFFEAANLVQENAAQSRHIATWPRAKSRQGQSR